MSNPRVSGIHIHSLADTLTEKARYLRRIIILDCCFAAAAFSAFQGGPDAVAVQKTITAFQVNNKAVGFPARGTSLLCSSNQKSPSLLLPDNSSTMFTKALLDALIKGTPSVRSHLSLRDVKDIATDQLSEIQNAPRPVVLSPDQSEGDIADIPFFPNPQGGQTYQKAFTGDDPDRAIHKIADYSAPPQPPQTRTPPAQPGSTPGNFLRPSHPWLFALSLPCYILAIVYFRYFPGFSSLVYSAYYLDFSSLFSLVIFPFFVIWIASTIIAARDRNWRWLVVIILSVGLGVIFFSIFAHPRQKTKLSTAGTGALPPQQLYEGPTQRSPQPSPQVQRNDQQGPQPSWRAMLTGSQESLALGPTTVNVGRGVQNQLILNDSQVSKAHAQIYQQGQDHIVIDLGSANGTFVNEQKLMANTPHPLKIGDKVRFGQTAFTYQQLTGN